MRQKVLKTLFLTLFLCGCIQSFAKTKIALIGDSPKTKQIADMILVKQANNKDIEFLERLEIEKVLNEHKLQYRGLDNKQMPLIARILHADVFAVLSSAKNDGKVEPSSIRIFDARSGFCLMDEPLPVQVENCVGFVSNKLMIAARNLTGRKKMKYVSILSVSNAGAPAKFENKLKQLAVLIERTLIGMPDFAVLERAKLDLVSRERRVTSRNNSLVPSAYLLDLEFVPGGTPDDVILNIYIYDATGKKLKKFKFDNCLERQLPDIIGKLASYFKSKPSVIAAAGNKKEAERFYREYLYNKYCGRLVTAKEKLNVAIAFDPYKPLYLHKLIMLIAEIAQKKTGISSSQKFDELIVAGHEIIRLGKKLNREFPEYNKPVYPFEAILCAMLNIWNQPGLINKKQQAAAEALASEIRPIHKKQIKRFYWKFDFKDGINSSREFMYWEQYMCRPCRFWFYFNYDKVLEARFKVLTEYFKRNVEFNKKYPKKGCQIPSWLPIDSRKYSEAFFRQMISQAGLDLIKAAKAHPEKNVKQYGCFLELARKTAMNDFNKAEFAENVDVMFKQILNIYGSNNIPKPNNKLYTVYWIMDSFKNHKPGLHAVFMRKRREFLKKDPEPGSWKAVRNDIDSVMMAPEKAEKIIKYADVIPRWRRCIRSDFQGKPGNTFRRWARRIRNYIIKNCDKIDVNTIACEEALEIMDRPLKVSLTKRVLSVDRYGNGWQISNAEKADGIIYILARNNRDISIFSFSPENCELRKLGTYKKVLSKKYISYSDFALRPFHITKQFFVIGDSDQIVVIPRNGNPLVHIKDLPAENVISIAMLEERIYAFCGKARNVNIMFSCLPDGKDRKIMISTLRRDKRNFFDRQKPFTVSGIFADPPRKRLLITCGASAQGLWEYTPQNNKFRKLLGYKNTYRLWSKKIDDFLYIAVRGNFSNYYIWDLKTDTFDFPYFNDTPDQLKWLKHKPRHCQWLNMQPPFFAYKNQDQFWGGGFGSRFIDLKAKNGMAFIHSLDCGIPSFNLFLIFPHPDKHSVFIVSKWSIYRVTPPRNEDVKIIQREKEKK